jgi:hypothetical protein
LPYFTITDFAAGLDLRRSELTAPAGTMRSMINCHITPGGEIEKRMAFVPFWECDPTTKGLVEVNQKLYTFAHNGPYKTEPSGVWSVGVLGQQLSTPIYEIVDYDLFDNRVFVILWVDAAGAVKRFYDGIETPSAKGFYCRTYKTKMYTVGGNFMHFSATGDPSKWYLDPPNTVQDGSGFLDLSLGDSDMTDSIALEVYYDKLAILSKTATQLWAVDPDPQKTQYVQTLRQAGTMAWRSVLQYGSGDVMYLSQSGIRSLRARNSSLAAAVSDIGSPLDPVIQDLYRYKGEDWMSGAIALLQPVTGRFWVIMGGSPQYEGGPLTSRIFILSAFPGPKITAWSEYDAGFVITAACIHEDRVIVRDDHNIVYAYGGISEEGPVYDDCPVELVFPFHAGEQVATAKTFTGLDATCEGVPWTVSGAFNVENPNIEDDFGVFDGATFAQGRFEIHGHSTHMSLRLRSQETGPQTVSNMVIHYQVAESG